MPYKHKRRIVRFGASSCGVVLPKGWVEFYGLQKGDRMVIFGDSVLIVARPEDEKRAQEAIRILEK
jgi:bifunctional DNA-binding transcriptional regulator/antitoxin component of YhaV-PrlF toxin-antitoxin module